MKPFVAPEGVAQRLIALSCFTCLGETLLLVHAHVAGKLKFGRKVAASQNQLGSLKTSHIQIPVHEVVQMSCDSSEI